MKKLPSIVILIASHNRGAILSDTLRGFLSVDVGDLSVEWVIIDNNSSDSTREVVQAFESQLPVRYLFESQPGKNCALNKALTECALADIVVFTDDDITPSTDWLIQIAKAYETWPAYAVFGGPIIPRWPQGYEPPWAKDGFIQAFAFARHDRGTKAVEYPADCYPFGGNFWVRKEVFDQGFRYNENVGPRPKNRVMGSESTFLAALAKAGYRMLYYPSAQVQHRIQAIECSAMAVQRRAIRLGRGEISLAGLPRADLRRKSQLVWHLFLHVKIVYASLLWCASWFSLSATARLRGAVDALRVMGNALESLRTGRI